MWVTHATWQLSLLEFRIINSESTSLYILVHCGSWNLGDERNIGLDTWYKLEACSPVFNAFHPQLSWQNPMAALGRPRGSDFPWSQPETLAASRKKKTSSGHENIPKLFQLWCQSAFLETLETHDHMRYRQNSLYLPSCYKQPYSFWGGLIVLHGLLHDSSKNNPSLLKWLTTILTVAHIILGFGDTIFHTWQSGFFQDFGTISSLKKLIKHCTVRWSRCLVGHCTLKVQLRSHPQEQNLKIYRFSQEQTSYSNHQWK